MELLSRDRQIDKLGRIRCEVDKEKNMSIHQRDGRDGAGSVDKQKTELTDEYTSR